MCDLSVVWKKPCVEDLANCKLLWLSRSAYLIVVNQANNFRTLTEMDSLVAVQATVSINRRYRQNAHHVERTHDPLETPAQLPGPLGAIGDYTGRPAERLYRERARERDKVDR